MRLGSAGVTFLAGTKLRRLWQSKPVKVFLSGQCASQKILGYLKDFHLLDVRSSFFLGVRFGLFFGEGNSELELRNIC